MINQIGKVGKINQTANKELAKLWLKKDICSCELGEVLYQLGHPVCGIFPLQNVHRHKRVWYRNQPEKLWDFKQVVRGCQSCHECIEKDKALTERVFHFLRGEE